ncbi:hypothetical protein MP228_005676 [Amoeboaphelidium protococcarum]|nr:hypothetical protein MP228_005676 [Amoeboaphelidium protococcarum]
METLVVLLRTISRMFYAPKQVIALDLLSQNLANSEHPEGVGSNGVVPEEELAFIMRMPVSQLRRLLAKCRSEGLIKVEQRSYARLSQYEPKFQGQKQKFSHRSYYYVDYQALYALVKYKVWKITSHLRQNPTIALNNKQSQGGKSQLANSSLISSRGGSSEKDVMYECPKCKMQFSMVEATKYIQPPNYLFICPYHREDEQNELQLIQARVDAALSESGYLKQWSELMNSMGIVNMLKSLEGYVIPRPNLDKEIARIIKKRELAEAQMLQQKGMSGASFQAGDGQRGGRGGVVVLDSDASGDKQMQGDDNDGGVQVEIQNGDELMMGDNQQLTAKELAAKEKVRMQNIMPFWHQQSTVSGADELRNAQNDKQKKQLQYQQQVQGKDGVRSAMDEYGTTVGTQVGAPASTFFGEGDYVTGMGEQSQEQDIMNFYEQYYASQLRSSSDHGSEDDEHEADVTAAMENGVTGGISVNVEEFNDDNEEDDDEEFEEVDVDAQLLALNNEPTLPAKRALESDQDDFNESQTDGFLAKKSKQVHDSEFEDESFEAV